MKKKKKTNSHTLNNNIPVTVCFHRMKNWDEDLFAKLVRELRAERERKDMRKDNICVGVDGRKGYSAG
jgi:hypothetical protein